MWDPSVTLDELVNTASTVFYNWDQMVEAKAQEKERRKESRHAQMMAASCPNEGPAVPKNTLTLQPQKDKCCICHQMATGHRSAPIRINLLRLLAINAISWNTEWPFAPQSKGMEDQWLLPRTEEIPSSWPQYKTGAKGINGCGG